MADTNKKRDESFFHTAGDKTDYFVNAQTGTYVEDKRNREDYGTTDLEPFQRDLDREAAYREQTGNQDPDTYKHATESTAEMGKPDALRDYFEGDKTPGRRQAADIQSGLYTLNLPSDYAQQMAAKAAEAQGRQAPEMDLRNYNQSRDMQLRALDAMNADRNGFISAGYEGQKAFNQSAQDAARQAARGGGLTNMADANQRNRNIAAEIGRQALSQDDATRNRLVQGAAVGRAQDLQVSKAQQQAQLAQVGMNQALMKFYLSQGMDYQEAQAQMQLEAAKIYAKRKSNNDAANAQTTKDIMGVIGTVVKMIAA